MYRTTMIVGLSLALLMLGACHEVGNHARTSAVHDGMRALGLVQRDDGSYEFKLCEMAESYTAEVLQEQCINPLLATDGSPLVLTEIPDRPGTFAAHSWNWAITALAAVAVGVGFYGVGRYIAKLLAAKKLGHKSYALGLERALIASKKYDHFELPERARKILKEEEAINLDGSVKVGADGQPIKDFFITDKLTLSSGREVNLKELLVNDKKLRKKLKDDEKEEISILLLELEQSFKSGLAYKEVIETGIEQIEKNGIASLSEAAREFVSNKKVLKSELEALKKNRPVKREYHTALRELDEEIAKLLSREAESIASRQRNIARLKAAAGLNDVLKAVEGADEGARIAAQMGNEKLLALSEDSLRNMVEEFSTLVNDSQKSAADVKTKLAVMQEEIKQAVDTWQEIADEATEIADDDVTKGISSFIKTTRRKQIKGWNKNAKDAEKELQQSFKIPRYESEAKKYEAKISEYINKTDSLATNIEFHKASEDILAETKDFLSDAGEKFYDDLTKLAANSEQLVGELEKSIGKAESFEDLHKFTQETVQDMNPFAALSDANQAKKLSDELQGKIEKIVTDSTDRASNEINKVGEDILAETKDFLSDAEKKFRDDLIKLADDSDQLKGKLDESLRKAGNFDDLRAFTQETVQDMNPFAPVSGANRAKEMIDELQGKIKKIADQAEERDKNNKVRFFQKYADKLRNFKFNDSKIFRYWQNDSQPRRAVRIRNEGEVLERFADNEDGGEVVVEKGLEKLFGHVAGVGTFAAFAVPATSLREKLNGHARISVSKHWRNLTGDYDLATAARIDDMRTIIEGLAEATGAKVSEEVFYFLLRSGLRNK